MYRPPELNEYVDCGTVKNGICRGVGTLSRGWHPVAVRQDHFIEDSGKLPEGRALHLVEEAALILIRNDADSHFFVGVP